MQTIYQTKMEMYWLEYGKAYSSKKYSINKEDLNKKDFLKDDKSKFGETQIQKSSYFKRSITIQSFNLKIKLNSKKNSNVNLKLSLFLTLKFRLLVCMDFYLRFTLPHDTLMVPLYSYFQALIIWDTKRLETSTKILTRLL